MSGLISDLGGLGSDLGGLGSDVSSAFSSAESNAKGLMADASTFLGGGGLRSDFSAITQALVGGSAVTLGPFAFDDTEVPQKLPYGIQQTLAVQKMIGGARQVNTLGPDPKDIQWTGTMRSADRASRAATLAQMTASGKTFPLAWGQEYLEVVIRSFTPVTQAFYITYTIVCCVVPASQSAAAKKPDLLTSVADDAMKAVGLSPADLPAVSSALGQVQDAVSAVSSLVPGSAVFGKILNATGVAQTALTGAQQAADGNLLGVINAAATGTGLLGIASATGVINCMGGVVQAAGDLGGAVQSLGYVNRMAKNLEAQF